jgi:hypothetical protein
MEERQAQTGEVDGKVVGLPSVPSTTPAVEQKQGSKDIIVLYSIWLTYLTFCRRSTRGKKAGARPNTSITLFIIDIGLRRSIHYIYSSHVYIHYHIGQSHSAVQGIYLLAIVASIRYRHLTTPKNHQTQSSSSSQTPHQHRPYP